MTYPPPGGQWQPNDPNQYPQQQGGHQQGGYQQPGYQQPGPYQQQPAGYQQQPPTPGYGQPQPQLDPYGQAVAAYGYGYPQPPKKKRKGLIVGSMVAVIALVAGAVVLVVALNRGDVAVGSANPQEAATKLVSAVGNADIGGLLVSLPPAEGALLRDLNKQATEELKRLDVFKKDADPNKVSGADIKTENLRFDDSRKQEVNDHLTITMLVDGKITLTSDVRNLPLTDKFLDLAFPKGIDTKPQTETIDIGKQVQRSKKPIRIATVKVDGEWYPSIFYTVADYALLDAKKSWPRTPIAAKGAATPGDAVRGVVDAALAADFERLIELMPPDELGALHDAGPVLIDAIAGKTRKAGAKIIKLETDTSSVTGGTKVTLRELEIEAEGQRARLVRNGDCYQATVPGEGAQKLCASDASSQFGGGKMPAGAKQALTHIAEGLFSNGLGVVTTEVDGKWYVSPGRSFFEIVLTALRSMQPQDVEALIKGR